MQINYCDLQSYFRDSVIVKGKCSGINNMKAGIVLAISTVFHSVSLTFPRHVSTGKDGQLFAVLVPFYSEGDRKCGSSSEAFRNSRSASSDSPFLLKAWAR